jgi:hypothetical protein
VPDSAHMVSMTASPRTVRAGDLSSEHLGTTFRSHTYRDARKTTLPKPSLSTFTADTIYHLKSGAILLNGSWPYLRPETELTVWDEEADAPVMVEDGIWRTEEELDALPVLAIIMDNSPIGAPHAYQKRRCIVGGQKLSRWFCTTDADWPESSERLLRDGYTYTTLWLPKGAL